MKCKKIAVLGMVAGGMVFGAGGTAHASLDTEAAAVGSPGVISGNNIQIPINIPINLCGNSINVVGLLNPTFGNYCQNGDNELTSVHQERHDGKHHGGKHDGRDHGRHNGGHDKGHGGHGR